MKRVFLSYRREDSQDITGRIFDRLGAHFGREQVFMDVDTIPIGIDFRVHLEQWVSTCHVVVVVIGDDWLHATAGGARRLDDPADFVRIEVESALARAIPVIPALVGGAKMPSAADLPATLQPLAFRNAAEVRSGRDFHDHMTRLVRGIERVLGAEPAASPAPAPAEVAGPAVNGLVPPELPPPGVTALRVELGTGRALWVRAVTSPPGVALLAARAASMRALDHRRIQRVVSISEQPPRFVAVEPADGPSLAELLARRVPVPQPVAVRIVRDLLSAVIAADAQGLTAPRIDPRRILLGTPHMEPEPVLCWIVPGAGMTELEGGVELAAPEALDEDADAAAQLYSLGQLLWELLMGRAAFAGSVAEIRAAKRKQATWFKSVQSAATASNAADVFVMRTTQPVARRRPSLAEAADLLHRADIQTPSPLVVHPVNLGFEGPVTGGVPHGWFDSMVYVGGVSLAYDVAVRPRDDAPGQCAMLSRRGGGPREFGSLMQRFPAAYLSGRRVRLSADIRTETLTGSAGLWMRADGAPRGDLNTMLFFDNMSDRPITGTTPWTRYKIDTELPAGVEWLNLGLLLTGDGAAWIDDVDLKVQEADASWTSLAWERLLTG